ncbi:MAG TPA: hypothetical protein VFU06_06805 [Longimicrobiales bacterium]|nr:hypothetical protein [Longimicrobiales bacterium]
MEFLLLLALNAAPPTAPPDTVDVVVTAVTHWVGDVGTLREDAGSLHVRIQTSEGSRLVPMSDSVSAEIARRLGLRLVPRDEVVHCQRVEDLPSGQWPKCSMDVARHWNITLEYLDAGSGLAEVTVGSTRRSSGVTRISGAAMTFELRYADGQWKVTRVVLDAIT